MKSLLTTGLVLATAASAALAQNRPADGSDAANQRGASTTPAVLHERIAEVSLQEVPLDQTLEWLADFTPVNVVVRWQVLEDAGVQRDTPITLEIHNLRLSQVLWIILREAGGPDVRLAYRVDPELLIVSTREDLARDMFVRVYDVSDLLLDVPRITDHIQIDITQTATGGSAPWATERENADPESEGGGSDGQHEKVERLIELIRNTVEPDSWDKNGGLGTISAWGSLLVVRNNVSVHQALGRSVAEHD